MLPIRPLAYADSSIESGSCTGPRYTRTSPSRETPGVLLNSVTDKYVTEFNLPYMNVARYVKEVESNWSKLSPEQKNIILQSIAKFQGDATNIDTFANDGSDMSSTYLTYLQTNPSSLGPFLTSVQQSGDPTLTHELNSFISKNSWGSGSIVMIIVFLLILCIIVFVFVKLS